MIKSETFVVPGCDGDVEVILNQIPGMQAGKALTRLTQTLGPTLAGIALAFKGEDMTAAVKAIEAAASKLSEAEFEWAVKTFVRGRVRVGDEFRDLDARGTIDDVFTGATDGLFLTLYYALKVNYGNFIARLGTKLPGLTNMIENAQKKLTVIPSKDSGQPNA